MLIRIKNAVLDLLAFCAASSIDAVQQKQDRPGSDRLMHAQQLAQELNLDMSAWFTPSADNYFSRVGKPQILEPTGEAKGPPPAPACEKLKKADLAKEPERQIAGTRWLLVPLR